MREKEVISLLSEVGTKPQGLRAPYPVAKRERTRNVEQSKGGKVNFPGANPESHQTEI